MKIVVIGGVAAGAGAAAKARRTDENAEIIIFEQGEYVSFANCGLLAVGLKYNVPLEEELKNPELQDINAGMFMKFRDKYLEVMGTTLCPELQKQIYGRSFIFTDPADCEEYWKIEDHAEKCAVVVEKATRMIAEFLLDNEKAE